MRNKKRKFFFTGTPLWCFPCVIIYLSFSNIVQSKKQNLQPHHWSQSEEMGARGPCWFAFFSFTLFLSSGDFKFPLLPSYSMHWFITLNTNLLEFLSFFSYHQYLKIYCILTNLIQERLGQKRVPTLIFSNCRS